LLTSRSSGTRTLPPVLPVLLDNITAEDRFLFDFDDDDEDILTNFQLNVWW
jgi:hypothetical protein